jgi:hypothetical protein
MEVDLLRQHGQRLVQHDARALAGDVDQDSGFLDCLLPEGVADAVLIGDEGLAGRSGMSRLQCAELPLAAQGLLGGT